MGLPPIVSEKVSSFNSNTGWTSRGENSSVLKKLEGIEFVDGTSGGMTPAVAYIQYWSRNGVARKKLEEAARDVFSLPPDKLSELTEQFEGAFKQPVSETNIDYFDPDIELPPFTGVPENLEIAEFRPPVDPEKGTEDTNVLPSEPFAGGIYGANPVSNYTDMETSAVWTFMFNPEELELSSGPDYNRAETWGVSDPANEGQPLSWRANRNRKLSFGKVLLHGYSLGKRVDSLEKGLQDLFMARDGENGADGPPVLEFIWGRRVFGPCVIQDIKVREKAWDAGYLVNAEVSFTLEQVPEWTINDGFVDVLRPGRQPTLSDPTVSSRDYRDTSTPETERDQEPEPEPEPDPRKPTTSRSKELQQIIKRCDRNYELSKKYGEFLTKLNAKPRVGIGQSPAKVAYQFIISRYKEYQALYRELKNITPGSSKLPIQYSADNVDDDIDNLYRVELLDKGDYLSFLNKSKAVLRKAGVESRKIVDKYYKGEECREAPKKLEELSKATRKKNERQFLCRNIKENSPCTVGVNSIRTNPCNNKVFKCSIKGRDPKELVYKELK